MRIGLSTGYTETFWGDWFTAKQIGGSERIVVRLGEELARAGHSVTTRLPYEGDEFTRAGVRYAPLSAGRSTFDLIFAFDDFAVRDVGRTVLVACRSDPPRHTAFDEMIFLSQHHARLMGHPDRPSVGGGVDLADYGDKKRLPQRVICTSSPDRCPLASRIGADFDFRHSYRPVGGVGKELDRAALIDLQRTAMVHIYPLDPVRPSDFFSMSVLESLAAGTPVVVSDADSMPELWSDVTLMLSRPIRLAEWHEAVEWLLTDKRKWKRMSEAGKKKAADLTWEKQASRYLAIAMDRKAEAA